MMLELELIQVTFGVRDSLSRVPSEKEWNAIFAFAEKHAIVGVLFGGVEKLPKEQIPYLDLLVAWFGHAECQKHEYQAQRASVESLVNLLEAEGLEVVELKGNSIGKYYPRPELRYSCDFDCLLSDYERGNRIVEAKGIVVNRDFYKNSSFVWNGLHVENHQFCTPVRGSNNMKRLERKLRDLMAKKDIMNFNALFLMEHAWAHFFEEALTMKQVCDWLVFRQECSAYVDWALFEREAKACGFWRFAVAMNGIVKGIIEPGSGFPDSGLTEEQRRLWKCVIAGGGGIEMNRGWRTRLQMVANFFRNGWKYRYFHDRSAMYVLVRTCVGFVLDRKPKI